MASSFRLTPNLAKGGDLLRLEVHGISKLSEYQGKSFSLQFFELDSGKEGGRAGNKNDLLAEFSVTVVNSGSKKEPKLVFEKVSRTDHFPTDFPKAEVRKTPEGEELSYAPTWKTPHFLLTFATASGTTDSFRIFIRGDVGEREGYVYEIGFKVLVSGKVFFDSFKMSMTLDCTGFLSHNCVQATKMLMADHQEMVVKRGIGLRFGSDCDYPDLPADRKKFHLSVTSCITYQLEAAALGHEKTAANLDWLQIKSSMRDGKGTFLFKGYAKAGWIGLYYNPDTENPADGEQEHPASYRIGGKAGTYYDVPVTDCIIDYVPTTVRDDGTPVPAANITKRVNDKLDKLKKVPFGVILARGGMHTAILMLGRVYEVHWKKGPRDLELYESCDFETEWQWLSGMIMVPPGSWE
jgi:hypothetical protein